MNEEKIQANETQAHEAHTPGRLRAHRRLFTVGGTSLVVGVLAGVVGMKVTDGHAALAAEAKAAKPAPTSPAREAQPAGEWNPWQQLRDMQQSMDRMFDWMASPFRLERLAAWPVESPGYSLSMHVRDLKDHFEVRAYLPNAKTSEVKVDLIDPQTLKLDVKNQSSATEKDQGRIAQFGEYSETIKLPAAVKDQRMKIDREAHEVRITLPKA